MPLYKRIKLDTLAKFFNTTRQTIATHEKEDKKPALKFSRQYLDENSINEFISTGAVSKFDKPITTFFNSRVANKILSDVNRSFNSIKNPWVKEIYRLFAVETKYKPLNTNIGDFLNNYDSEKDYFYDALFSYLHKNKKRFDTNNRREVGMFMSVIFEQTEIYVYYYLTHISNETILKEL